MIVVQQRRIAGEYAIPSGGEILWYGIAANVPTGFIIDSFASNVFVKGADTNGASNTQQSDFSHGHTNPASTGTQAAHVHSTGGGDTGMSSGSTVVYQTPNADLSSPHTHSIGVVNSGSAGGHSHTLSGASALAVYPPYRRLYWIKATSEVALPIGGIVMWDNPIASRPLKTKICDGLNSTPDLRANFIYGASSDGEVGTSGGTSTHTHANSGTGNAGSHSHSLNPPLGGGPNDHDASTFAGTTVAAGGHDHGTSTTSDVDADHSHTLSNTGSSSHVPPYLKLYFVMRTE